MWPWDNKKDIVEVPIKDIKEETEMCDVCCRNFPYTQIRRVSYVHPRGTFYRIRVCPYCNPNTLIGLL